LPGSGSANSPAAERIARRIDLAGSCLKRENRHRRPRRHRLPAWRRAKRQLPAAAFEAKRNFKAEQ
jgi:hypothetical protein